MPIWSTEIKELERLGASFKGQFPELEKELERLIKANDENMIRLVIASGAMTGFKRYFRILKPNSRQNMNG